MLTEPLKVCPLLQKRGPISEESSIQGSVTSDIRLRLAEFKMVKSNAKRFFKHILWNLWLYYMFLNSAYFSFFNGGHTNARSTDRSTVEDMADMVVHRFVLHTF